MTDIEMDSVTMDEMTGDFFHPTYLDVPCGKLHGLTGRQFESCLSLKQLRKATKGSVTFWPKKHFPSPEGTLSFDCTCIVCNPPHFERKQRCHSCRSTLKEHEQEEELCQFCIKSYRTFCIFCYQPLMHGKCVSEGVVYLKKIKRVW